MSSPSQGLRRPRGPRSPGQQIGSLEPSHRGRKDEIEPPGVGHRHLEAQPGTQSCTAFVPEKTFLGI